MVHNARPSAASNCQSRRQIWVISPRSEVGVWDSRLLSGGLMSGSAPAQLQSFGICDAQTALLPVRWAPMMPNVPSELRLWMRRVAASLKMRLPSVQLVAPSF